MYSLITQTLMSLNNVVGVDEIWKRFILNFIIRNGDGGEE